MDPVEPPWPLNEPARLEKLKGYRVLDTPQEPLFDHLTRLGSRHFAMPICLITLLDESRQWFKSRVGLDLPYTSRHIAFCAYTILENQVMVVPDATVDERFADNPLVTGESGFRFYAGAPLNTPEGLLLGTFCVIDTKPHTDFGAEERRDLEEFARIIIHELEARSAHRAVEEARAEAVRANAAKTRFLAAASHDLRQPIQSMLLFAGTLGSHIHDGRGREKLALLERSLDTLRDLLEGLFDMSRLDSGAMDVQLADFPFRPLIEEIEASYAPIAASKQLAFRVGGGCGVLVRSDRTMLGQILRNLVENAIRYTDAGHVEVDCVPSPKGIRIEVRDTGIGIPADHLDRIFEEFHQVGNPERDRTQGLGIGLAIVQRLSHLLGHPVSVQSKPGRGSIFSVEVPRGVAQAELPLGEALPGGPSGKERLVLLVDDDAIVLAALRSMFQEWGYKVLVAGSTEHALERVTAAQQHPDLVVADYRLRGGKVGTEAILKVRELTRQPIPGIILTGENSSACERDAAAHGLAVTQKPVTPQQLSLILQRLLG
ncbi:MAG TPA: ATP-binding protein [Azospirillum sp.]|nr:ATP-binding protein [Azospirillum sp.]